MRYPYHCPGCEESFEVKKPMAEATRKEHCGCGHEANRVYAGLPFLFGQRLTEASHRRFGPENEFERNV